MNRQNQLIKSKYCKCILLKNKITFNFRICADKVFEISFYDLLKVTASKTVCAQSWPVKQDSNANYLGIKTNAIKPSASYLFLIE